MSLLQHFQTYGADEAGRGKGAGIQFAFEPHHIGGFPEEVHVLAVDICTNVLDFV